MEILWAREIQRLTGSALPTVALVTAIFMSGLLVGSCIASKLANLFQADQFRRPLRIYTFSQVLLSGVGLAFILFRPQLYALLENISTADPHGRTLAECLRLTVIGLILLIPTSLIGAGFPLIVQALARGNAGVPANCRAAQADAALIYFANVLGSLFGALLCGFYMLPRFGMALSMQMASMASLLSAICAYAGGKGQPPSQRLNEIEKAEKPAGSRRSQAGGSQAGGSQVGRSQAAASQEISVSTDGLPFMHAGVAVLWSGFVVLLLEMLWLRLGLLIFGSSSYALSVVLVCQFLGSAIGAFSVAFVVEKNALVPWALGVRQAAVFIKAATLCAGVWVTFSTYIFFLLPHMFLQTAFWLQPWASACPLLAFLASRLFIGGFLILPASIALGTIFPLAIATVRHEGQNIGWLYVLNIFGSIYGCIIGGVLLLPVLTHITSTPLLLAFKVAAITLFAFAIAFKFSDLIYGQIYSQRALSAIGVLSVVILLAIPPLWPKAVMSSGPAFLTGLTDLASKQLAFNATAPEQERNLLFYQEGENAITTVMLDRKKNLRLLRTDGKIEAALPANVSLPSQNSDEPTHILLGELPLLLSPRRPSDILLIGFGSGITADTILDHPSVSKLTVAELERSVCAAAPYFADNRRNDGNDRTTIVNCDGRNYLSLVTKNYDVIVSQPGEPFLSGMADLYTLEFWQLARRRLQEGGMFCQWLQLYAVKREDLTRLCRTFYTVFPNTLIFRSERAGEILLVGFKFSQRHGTEPWIDFNALASRFHEQKVRRRLTYIGIEQPEELISNLHMTPSDLDRFVATSKMHLGAPLSAFLNTDDNTTVEWALPVELNQHGPTLTSMITELFSQVPANINRVFFNTGIPDHAALPSSRFWQDLTAYPRSLNSIKKVTEKFKGVIKADPDSARAKEDAGIALIAMGQATCGVGLLRQALLMNPNLYQARLVLGRQLLQEGQEKDGLKELYWASHVNPDTADANLSVTAYYVLAGNWQAAKKNMTILIRQLPGDSRVNYLKNIIASKRVTVASDPILKAVLDPIPIPSISSGDGKHKFVP